MADFVPGTAIETKDPTVEVTVTAERPLPPGRHQFQLVVVDDAGNLSLPDTVDIIVKDTLNPTAVLKAPAQVEYGASFVLDGRGSSDVIPGKVVKYVWTRVSG